MDALNTHLAHYGAYHLDRRNVATHFVGIPLIVFAIGVLLARIPLEVAGLQANAAWLLCAVSALWYLSRGALVLGLATVGVNALLMALATPFAQGSTAAWLSMGVGSFVVGWIIQFIGHYYEGRKPAFVDDLMGLVVGPLFVVAELGFLLGLRADVQQAVEHRAGPTCIRPRKALAS